jgi:hypothetical protein
MILLMVFQWLMAQDRVLVEQGKVQTLPKILSEDLSIASDAVTVVVPNSDEIPEYFFQSHVAKPFTDILKERERLVCEAGTASYLSCFSCKQENDKFVFSYEFGKKPDTNECILVRYSVAFKSDKNQEQTTIAYLKKMGFAVDEQNFATPMVFEKPPMQINVKLQDRFLVIDILEPEMQSLRASFDSKHTFLFEEMRQLWPLYVTLTEQYLVEVGVEIKGVLNSKKSTAISSDDEFTKAFEALRVAAAKVKAKEDRACLIYQEKDLLQYPVTEQLNTELKTKVKNHWSEYFQKDLKETVCGNYYFLEKVKSDFNNTATCDGFSVFTLSRDLEIFLTKNISATEKQLATIFLTTLQIKSTYKNMSLPDDKKVTGINASLSTLSELGDSYKSYVNFKKTHIQSFKPELDAFRCVL